MQNQILTSPSQHPLAKTQKNYNKVVADRRRRAAQERLAERAEDLPDGFYLALEEQIRFVKTSK
jgi:hypothetical protein